VIATRDLTLVLDGRTILDGVSFAVARGESVAVVGPNGSGKTSILRCLLGLVPFTGTASVDGHDVVRDPVGARARLGYVPQKTGFGDALAREVLAFVARLRRVDACGLPELLAAVGLAEHAEARVRTYSGGMQQRLALAVALVGDPPVLLLDEPSASLDAEGQQAFVALVGRLRRRGHTLLLASHRAEEVAALTDRVLRVDRGRVVTAFDTPRLAARVIGLVRRGGPA
jgi:ABC-type multidrug transport system ATPase subunit